MGNKPAITVITPVYNAHAKLRQTIESVLRQPRDLFEYWVIDGGSTDGTVDLLGSFGADISWVSEPDRGVYDAMNKGIARAQGRYLYFLGAGDVLHAGVLEKVLELLPAGGRPTFAYGDVFWVSSDPIHGGKIFGGPFDRDRITFHCPNHQSIFYDRRIFEMLGDYDLDYKVLSDYVLNIKCFGDRRVRKQYLNIVIANYEGGGYSARVVDELFFANRLALVRRYLGPWCAWKLVLSDPRSRLGRMLALTRDLKSRSLGYLAKKMWLRLTNRRDRQSA